MLSRFDSLARSKRIEQRVRAIQLILSQAITKLSPDVGRYCTGKLAIHYSELDNGRDICAGQLVRAHATLWRAAAAAYGQATSTCASGDNVHYWR